ncbi:MAG: hypothetical protein MUE69_28645 [Myxococcota bacterium]|nr:hypothetical protein [Myxococcota bacterium]
MKWVVLTFWLGACASDATPFDAGSGDTSVERDATRDALESPVDATTDAFSFDGALAHDAATATRDASIDSDAESARDASSCVALSVGAYEVDGAIPTACPVGAGEAVPAPVVSYASACRIRIDPDPVLEDRLVIEGELHVDGAMLEGTLSLNGIETACVGFVEDDVIALDCGECDVRLRARRG